MAYGEQSVQSDRLGSWYNSWDDLWGDVKAGASIITGGARGAQNAANTAGNVANNALNATSARINVTTLLAAGVGALLLMEIMNNRRR